MAKRQEIVTKIEDSIAKKGKWQSSCYVNVGFFVFLILILFGLAFLFHATPIILSYTSSLLLGSFFVIVGFSSLYVQDTVILSAEYVEFQRLLFKLFYSGKGITHIQYSDITNVKEIGRSDGTNSFGFVLRIKTKDFKQFESGSVGHSGIGWEIGKAISICLSKYSKG